MNIPIRKILDEELNFKLPLTFEFEIGHYDQRGSCCKKDKIEVIHQSENDTTIDHES